MSDSAHKSHALVHNSGTAADIHQAISTGDRAGFEQALSALCPASVAVPAGADPDQFKIFYREWCGYIHKQSAAQIAGMGVTGLLADLIDPAQNKTPQGTLKWFLPERDEAFHLAFTTAAAHGHQDVLRELLSIREPDQQSLKWAYLIANGRQKGAALEEVLDDYIARHPDGAFHKKCQDGLQQALIAAQFLGQNADRKPAAHIEYYSLVNDPEEALIAARSAIQRNQTKILPVLTTLIKPNMRHQLVGDAITHNRPILAGELFQDLMAGEGYHQRNPFPSLVVPWQTQENVTSSLLQQAMLMPDKSCFKQMIEYASPKMCLMALQAGITQDRPRSLDVILNHANDMVEQQPKNLARPWGAMRDVSFSYALRYGSDACVERFLAADVPITQSHLTAAAGRGDPDLCVDMLHRFDAQYGVDDQSFGGNWPQSKTTSQYARTLLQVVQHAAKNADEAITHQIWDHIPQNVRKSGGTAFYGAVLVAAASRDDEHLVQQIIADKPAIGSDDTKAAIRWTCRNVNKSIFDLMMKSHRARPETLIDIAHEMAEMQTGDPHLEQTVHWILDKVPNFPKDDLESLASCAHEQQKPPVYLAPVLKQLAAQQPQHLDMLLSDFLSQKTSFHTPDSQNLFTAVYVAAGALRRVVAMFDAVERNDSLQLGQMVSRLPLGAVTDTIMTNLGHRAIIDGHPDLLPVIMSHGRMGQGDGLNQWLETAQNLEDTQTITMLQNGMNMPYGGYSRQNRLPPASPPASPRF